LTASAVPRKQSPGSELAQRRGRPPPWRHTRLTSSRYVTLRSSRQDVGCRKPTISLCFSLCLSPSIFLLCLSFRFTCLYQPLGFSTVPFPFTSTHIYIYICIFFFQFDYSIINLISILRDKIKKWLQKKEIIKFYVNISILYMFPYVYISILYQLMYKYDCTYLSIFNFYKIAGEK